MITNNSNVTQILEQPTLDYDVKEITFLSSQEVVNAKELKLTSQGSIYVSNAVMLELVIRGNYKDTEKEKINFTRKIRHVDVDNNAIQTIDYGTFIIMNAEYDNGSEATTLLCYDLMVQTQREYVKEDVTVTFPNTVKNVLSSVVQASGLELDTNTFNNENVVVGVDYWVNASYTYRDVLDHIAQLTTSTIKIKNGKVHVFDIEDTGVTLKDNFVNLKLGEQYGKTNILNISQEPQHDNFFSPANAMDIPVDDRKELVFANNPILYPEAQEWADELLPLVSDLEYTTAEFKTYQGGIFEVGDKVKVYAKSTDSYHDVIITKQVYTNTNVQVDLVSSKPFSFKSEYVVETDQKREGQTTYFIVDKQNGIIEGLISTVDEVEGELIEQSSRITQTQDSITQEIIDRTTQGELIVEQTSSLVQQTVDSFDVIFNKIEIDQDLTNGEIELIQSYFRINENGVIIGKSDSAIEFFAENNRVGFRENGNDIAYWEEGTMHVDRLIAVTTIMVGYHLIEKYDSPVAGNTTIVRLGD